MQDERITGERVTEERVKEERSMGEQSRENERMDRNGRERANPRDEWIRIAERLRTRPGFAPLTPTGVWHPGLDRDIAALPVDGLDEAEPGTEPASAASGAHPGARAEAARALKAAFHLWNDHLQAAHDLVAHASDPASFALHGIMHRREGDYGNAKYWFRRTGDHPAFHGLPARVADIVRRRRREDGWHGDPVASALEMLASHGAWNPYLFVDAVAMQERRVGGEETRAALEEVQHEELMAMIRYLAGRLGLRRDGAPW